MHNTYETTSYEKHINHVESGNIDRLKDKSSINYWRHERMYKLLLPLVNEKGNWLTVGDGIGTDANWLCEQGVDVMASDISDTVLKMAANAGYIDKYKAENAEMFSFDNDAFDYVFCKEAYHHFPRPYIAVYEMLRVSRKAVVFIEPVDIAMHMPLMVAMKNILDRFSPNLINKLWKNRYSFETSGNYVYKISEREIEKIAMGINLRYVAFKGINDYYNKGSWLNEPVGNKRAFRKIRKKIGFKNFLSKLGVMPYQNLCCIIFKTPPGTECIEALKQSGFKTIKLKANPYAD